jgi:hypothetical protein
MYHLEKRQRTIKVKSTVQMFESTDLYLSIDVKDNKISF